MLDVGRAPGEGVTAWLVPEKCSAWQHQHPLAAVGVGSHPQGAQPANLGGGSLPQQSSVAICMDWHHVRVPKDISSRVSSPKHLISDLFPNDSLAQLERPEFLMPKLGRTNLALGRPGSCCLFPFWVPLC